MIFLRSRVFVFVETCKKNITLLLMIVFFTLNSSVFSQIYYPNVRQNLRPAFKIMSIGITDSLTHIFIEYANTEEVDLSFCASEEMVLMDTKTKKKYKLVGTLNIPVCPACHFSTYRDYFHYFALTFEALPLTTTEIDIVNPSSNNMYMYGVSLLSNDKTGEAISFIDLIEEYPVKEKSFFYKDGRKIQYYIHNGLVIAMNLSISNDYGKYYCANISIENFSKKRVDFFPHNIRSNVNDWSSVSNNSLNVLTFDEYIKKVNKSQNLSLFFVVLGESLSASQAGYSKSLSNTDISSSYRQHSFSWSIWK